MVATLCLVLAAVAVRPETARPSLRLRGGEDTSSSLSEAELDELFVRATRLRPELSRGDPTEHRTILPQWDGRPEWLWRQWRGTILEATWSRMLTVMLGAAGLLLTAWGTAEPSTRWPIWAAPDESHPLVRWLKLVHQMWSIMLTITTFVTTFMIGHAYAFWSRGYAHARKVQGRLGDLGLLLSTHAAREKGVEREGECFAPGDYTPAAKKLIALMTRRMALLHVLFWAGVVRQAPGSDRFGVSFNMLLSDQCLAHLAKRGALTRAEHVTARNGT